MYARAVASLGIWVVQLLTIGVRLDHGQDVDSSVWLVIVVNPLIAILPAIGVLVLVSSGTRRSAPAAV